MRRLIECVPNFSEGRDPSRIRAIVGAMSGVAGSWVLDCHSDPDHNRTVVTLAGQPEGVEKAILEGVRKATELIDLRNHSGVHPRLGATDVIPFVPIESATMEECVAIAHRVGREIWQRFQIPVYFYGAASISPERSALEAVRKGQFEKLRKEIGQSADRAPDVGEAQVHPSAGAIAVSARKPLVAFNVNLNTSDVCKADKIARAIRRFRDTVLPGVKAMGVLLESRRQAQVSMNITDFEVTPLRRVFEVVSEEAARHGCAAAGSEIVGLVPRKALDQMDLALLHVERFSPSMILENQLAKVLAGEGLERISTMECGL